MKQKLLDELMEVSEEEQKYLDGQGDIEKQLYAKEKIEEIDRELLLKRGQLITVRPHSRFVDFPEHRHNYVEIMYVAQGSITHCILSRFPESPTAATRGRCTDPAGISCRSHPTDGLSERTSPRWQHHFHLQGSD